MKGCDRVAILTYFRMSGIALAVDIAIYSLCFYLWLCDFETLRTAIAKLQPTKQELGMGICGQRKWKRIGEGFTNKL